MASSDDATASTATVGLTHEQLASAANLTVFDAKGNKIRFGSLFELQKCIVVFIRHFFCGNCQQYVSKLTSVKPEELEKSGVSIIVVGCGDWLLINNYKELTCEKSHSAIAFYADPSRAVYGALGVTAETLQVTPKDEDKKSYLQKGRTANLFASIFHALKSPLHVGKQGNLSQLGGEFIIGPGNTCSFGHYMRHTEDHVDVADLFREAGVQFP